MVTNYPHSIASHHGLRHASVGIDADNLGVRAIVWFRQMLCGLTGHDTLLNFEQERMSLRCASCGHDTPGWDLNETPPTVTLRGDARRHMLRTQQLIRERQIA